MPFLTDDEKKQLSLLGGASENVNLDGNPIDRQIQRRALPPSELTEEEKRGLLTADTDPPADWLGQIAEEWAPTLDHWGDRWEGGWTSVAEGHLGYEAMNGRMSLEDAEAKIGNVQEIQARNDKIKQFKENAPLWVDAIGGAIETTPFMLSIGQGAAIGGAALGTANAAKGAVQGAVGGAVVAGVLGQAGPQAAAPEELITVPGMAIAGAKEGAVREGLSGLLFGAKTGAYFESSRLQGGMLYMRMRRQGIPHDAASKYAAVGGATMGALEWTQVKQLGQIGLNAYKHQLESAVTKPGVLNSIATFLTKTIPDMSKKVALEIAEEINQTQIELISMQSAALASGMGSIIKWNDWADEIMSTAWESAKIFPVLGAGSATTGSISGAMLKKAAATIQEHQDVKDITQRIKQAMINAPTKKEEKEIEKTVRKLIKEYKQKEKGVRPEAKTKEQIAEEYRVKEEDAAAEVRKMKDEVKQAQRQKNIEEATTKESSVKTRNALTEANYKLKIAQESLKKAKMQVAKAELQASAEGTTDSGKQEVSDLTRDIVAQTNNIRIARNEANIASTKGQIEEQIVGRQAEIDRELKSLEADKGELKAAGFRDKDLKADASELRSLKRRLKSLQQSLEDGSITKEEIEQVLGTKESQPLRKLLTRLSQQEAEGDALNTLKTLLSDNLLTDEDITALKDKIRDGEVHSVVRTVAARINKAARDAKWETKKDRLAVQKRLKALLRYSGLNEKGRLRMENIIDKIDSPEALKQKLGKVYNMIDILLEKQERAKADKRLTNILKDIEDNPSVSAGGSPYDFDSQAVLSRYKELIEDARKKDSQKLAEKAFAAARNAEQAEAAQQDDDANTGKINPPTIAPNIDGMIAADVMNWEQKGSVEINALANTLENIVVNGKDQQMADALAEAKQIEETVQKAVEEANGIHPLFTYDIVDGVKKRVMHEVSKAGRKLRSLGETHASWNLIMDRIFIDSKNRNAKDLVDVHDEVQTEEDNIRDQETKALATLTKDGDKALTKLLREVIEEEKETDFGEHVRFVPGVGNVHESLVLRRAEAIQLLLTLRNRNRDQGIAHGNGYTYKDQQRNAAFFSEGMSTEELLEKKLTADGTIHFVNALAEIRNGEMFSRLNDGHIDEYRFPLPKQDNYDGHRRRIAAPDPGTHLDLFNSMNDLRGFEASTLFEAEQSKTAYVIGDAFQNLANDIRMNEHWLAFRKKAKLLRALGANQDFREIVEHKFGKDTYTIFTNMYQYLIGTRNIQHVQNVELVGIYRRNAATAFTGGKPINAASQFSGIMNYGVELTGKELRDGVADFFKNQDLAMTILGNTRFLRNRHANMELSLTERFRQNGLLASVGIKNEHKVVEKMMAAIMWCDRHTICIGGWALYRAEFKRVLDETDDEQKAHEQAIAKFERVSNRMQGSSTADQITYYERGGDWNKVITLFLKQPIQAAGQRQVDLLRVIAHNDDETKAQLFKTVLATHMGQMAFQAMVSSWRFTTGDDKDRAEEFAKVLWSGFWGPQLPLVGTVLYDLSIGGSNMVFGTDITPFPPTVLPVAAAVSLLDASALMFKLGKRDNPETARKENQWTDKEKFRLATSIARVAPFVSALPWQVPITVAKEIHRLGNKDSK